MNTGMTRVKQKHSLTIIIIDYNTRFLHPEEGRGHFYNYCRNVQVVLLDIGREK